MFGGELKRLIWNRMVGDFRICPETPRRPLLLRAILSLIVSLSPLFGLRVLVQGARLAANMGFANRARRLMRLSVERCHSRAENKEKEFRGKNQPCPHCIAFLEPSHTAAVIAFHHGFFSDLPPEDRARARNYFDRGHQLVQDFVAGAALRPPSIVISGSPDALYGNNPDRSPAQAISAYASAVATDVACVPDFLFQSLAAIEGVFLVSHHTVSNHKRTINIKAADISPYVLVDERGFSGWSRASLAPERVPSGAETESMVEFCRSWVSAFAPEVSRTRAEVLPPSKSFFFALQVRHDLTQRLRHLHPMIAVTVLGLSLFGKRARVVVKRHPESESMAEALVLGLLRLFGLIEISSESALHLISKCDYIVTVNSSVGSQAMMFQKPVITMGLSDYHHGTIQVSSYTDLRRLALDYEDLQPPANLCAYAHFYRTEILTDTSDLTLLHKKLVRALSNIGYKGSFSA